MHTALVCIHKRRKMEATGMSNQIILIALVVSQLILFALYVLLARSVAELRFESHHHTFFYNKTGEKVHEFISVHKHGGVINERLD